jgi:hypothetical protein
MLRTTIVLSALGLAGCAQRSEQQTVAVAAPVIALDQPAPPVPPLTPDKPEAKPATPAAQTPVAQTPAGFEYPADLGGQAVSKAVAPEVPAVTTAERFGKTPRPRKVSSKLLHPEHVAATSYTPPPVQQARLGNVRIGSPKEVIPLDLGHGVLGARPSMPIAAGITERARDVNLPPTMPTLGKPAADRVSLDDPTGELGHAAIIAPVVSVPLAPSEFTKVSLPDPFELAAQVKPNVPPKDQPGLQPVPVSPPRIK